MKKVAPIFLADLLPDINCLLISFLKELSVKEWEAQTIAPRWKVKDIAVHLLDGNLRTLSMLRDGYFGESPGEIHSYDDLLSYLNRLNADWVRAMKRLSPSVIIDLLEQSGKEYCDYLASLDPFDKSPFSVGWAGEKESLNWFHIAREYTEKWHHQQQMRLAVGNDEELLKANWFLPYLDTSIRALPHHYRHISGRDKDLIKFVFTSDVEHCWFLKWQENTWQLLTESEEGETCEVIIPDRIAWRIFSKEIPKADARQASEVRGDQKLGEVVFDMVAVMA